MAPTYHMLNTLGIRKEAIARTLAAIDNHDENWQQASRLVARRTQDYTAAELQVLMQFYLTASDECKDEFPEDYNPLEVHTARAKIARYDAAMAVLAAIPVGLGFPLAAGKLTLELTESGAVMRGGTSPHAIWRSGESQNSWLERVKAHWGGYCTNNGVTL